MSIRLSGFLFAFGALIVFTPGKAVAGCSHRYEAPINTLLSGRMDMPELRLP